METTTTTTTAKTICLAYFADGKFIGWYGDTFGSIRKDSPKTYTFSDSQIETIAKNFRHKLSKIGKTSELGKIKGFSGLGLLDESINDDSSTLSQYKEIELRIIECPFYDGINPNYDKEKFKEWADNERILAEKELRDFTFSNCPKELNNWIYADYSKIQEWAKNEPTEFIGTITA